MMLLLPGQPLPSPQSAYEAQALDFCRRWQAGEPAFELHTSGSTGTPKPIRLTRAQMQASAQLTGRTFDLQPGDAALCCLHVGYIAGTMMLVRALELGLRLTVVEPAANPLRGVPGAFDFYAFVPLQLQAMVNETPERIPDLDAAKAILVGGAAVSPVLQTALQGLSAPVFATYGMTETVSHVAIRRLNGPAASEVFRVLDGVRVGTDDRDCLWIEGAMTDEQRVQTSDVVDLDAAAGTFYLRGRADLVINSGGVKISLEAVERAVAQALGEQGQAQGFLAWFLPDATLGQRLVGVWEKEAPQRIDLQKFESSLRKYLSRYEIPKTWLYSPAFSYTSTGKLDRPTTVRRLTEATPES
jgi:O-succinylbenzoic acid--CoA ligase